RARSRRPRWRAGPPPARRPAVTRGRLAGRRVLGDLRRRRPRGDDRRPRWARSLDPPEGRDRPAGRPQRLARGGPDRPRGQHRRGRGGRCGPADRRVRLVRYGHARGARPQPPICGLVTASGDAPLGIGMVGCGNVSTQYVAGLAGHDGVRLVACSDADPARAAALATRTGIRALELEALFGDPDVDIVLNLTPVAIHPAVSLAAIGEGRHVHSEKPLAIDRGTAQAILARAERAGLRVGCAPDTFLGSSLQTARAEVDGGRIGEPVGFSVAFVNGGPEVFHPAPAQFFGPGAGPVLDVGVYYLTALVHLLGPIRAVVAIDRVTFPEREVLVGPAAGTRFPVTVPSHVVGAIELASGVVGGFTMSFDAGVTAAPKLVLQGAAGTMVLGDPNTF